MTTIHYPTIDGIVHRNTIPLTIVNGYYSNVIPIELANINRETWNAAIVRLNQTVDPNNIYYGVTSGTVTGVGGYMVCKYFTFDTIAATYFSISTGFIGAAFYFLISDIVKQCELQQTIDEINRVLVNTNYQFRIINRVMYVVYQ